MRLDIILTVFRKELTELLRDRRSLMVMFGVPLVVYPLLFMAVGSVAKGKAQEGQQREVKIAVHNAAEAPALVALLKEKERNFNVVTGAEVASGLEKDEITAVIEVPPHAEADWAAGRDTVAPLTLRVDRSRSLTGAAEDRIDAALDAYAQQVIRERLAAKGMTPDILQPIKRSTIDIASKEQRSGKFLAQTVPMLLLITGMLGALFPALNTTTTEKELGTLETLLVSPARRSDLLIAKGLLVCCCSLLTAGLNMASMSAVFLQVAKNTAITATTAPAASGLGISPWLLLHAYAAAIPALILFSAMVLCVGLIARTYREASSFATPVMMLPMAGMIVAMMDPPTTNALLMTPVVSTTLIIRDILTSRSNWGDFALVWISSLAYAGLVISMAARLFTNEQLVNPAWEPLSLKGLRRKGTVKRRLRMPTVDEAVVLVLALPLVQFYAGPWLGKLLTDTKGINAPLFVLLLQLASVLAPLLIIGTLGRWNWRAVLPTVPVNPMAVAGALLVGPGLAAIGVFYSLLYKTFVHAPTSQANTNVAELIESSVNYSPVVAVLAFGVIPGVCEELMFRGGVLSGFRRSLKTPAAVIVTALLFAAVHMDWAGFPLRALLGVVLGFLVVRSASLIPSIILHACFNSCTVAIAIFLGDKLVKSTPTGPVPNLFGMHALALLAVGVVLLVLGTVLLLGSRVIEANGRSTAAAL